ncbi:hypothetical protein EJ08DRAFT_290101 [Tothia fuscella]|uniref:Uncharacterized protein n=1 Tax=Tothia fuscella TaxID=1048955 RepID=A0A9P4P205_9PEZI|nr:hypothetical protein EJ08DRAFT_290101 [Tothia fuscella]
MTYITFLAGSLLFTTLALAAPAAQDQSQSESSTCQTGTTVCIDLYNGCGGRTGGCYDSCRPTTYTAPPCDSSSTIYSSSPPIITSTGNDNKPTPALSELINAGLFAEKLAAPVVEALPSPTLLPQHTPPQVDPPPPVQPTPTTAVVNQLVDTVPLGPAVADVDAPINAAMITAAPDVPQRLPTIECGVKTSCWDAVSSMGPKCPRVRYGGCYDVCRGDPKTIFTPRPCKA